MWYPVQTSARSWTTMSYASALVVGLELNFAPLTSANVELLSMLWAVMVSNGIKKHSRAHRPIPRRWKETPERDYIHSMEERPWPGSGCVLCRFTGTIKHVWQVRTTRHCIRRGSYTEAFKYSKLKSNYHFVAFAVESLGPWSKEAIDLINKIGANLIRITGEPKAKLYLIQKISLAIQHGNALSITSSIPKTPAMDEIFLIQWQ